MIRVNIVCIGKIKESYYRDAVAEYQKRLSRFCRLNITELPECLLSGTNSADIDRVRDSEGREILRRSKGRLIICDLGGRMVTSPDIGELLEKSANAVGEVTFVIGGSYGLSEDVKAAADDSICFGRVTYPHQLMRVILAEQIYRGFMINSGSEYHK